MFFWFLLFCYFVVYPAAVKRFQLAVQDIECPLLHCLPLPSHSYTFCHLVLQVSCIVHEVISFDHRALSTVQTLCRFVVVVVVVGAAICEIEKLTR